MNITIDILKNWPLWIYNCKIYGQGQWVQVIKLGYCSYIKHTHHFKKKKNFCYWTYNRHDFRHKVISHSFFFSVACFSIFHKNYVIRRDSEAIISCEQAMLREFKMKE